MGALSFADGSTHKNTRFPIAAIYQEFEECLQTDWEKNILLFNLKQLSTYSLRKFLSSHYINMQITANSALPDCIIRA